VRIDSSVPGSLGNVAFRNPDGTVVLVVLNDTDSGQAHFTVRTGGSAFSASLPAGAVATFVQQPGGGADTQPPSVPSGVVVTGQTANSVSLSWTASTDNVGVTGYDVYNGGAKAATVTSTSATVGGLASGTTYSFTVRARDAAGNVSAPSAAVTATTNAAGRTGPITGTGGKCVDVAGANTANGTAVQLYTCNGTGAQRWTVGGDGTLTALGKCADVAFGATDNGAKVQLYDCNGTGAQVWQPQPNGTLRNPQSGKCLDATDRSSADGTRLQIWDCHGDVNQVWHLPT
jgi:chitodextrinase